MNKMSSLRLTSVKLTILLVSCILSVSCNVISPTGIPSSFDDSSETSSSYDSGSSGSSSDNSSYDSTGSSSSSSSDYPDSSDSSTASSEPESSAVSQTEPDPTPEAVLYRYITDVSANLRTEASSQSVIIKKLVYGTKLRYISDSGAWTKVITMDELNGYIFTELLSEDEPDPLHIPLPEVKTLEKWPAEFTVSGFYDALMANYIGRFSGQGYLPLKGVTVILDPGHGGVDGGAVYTSSSGKSVLEKKINLEIALKVGTDLEALGAEVVFTRTDDQFYGLYTRSAIINSIVLQKHREILVRDGLDTTETDRLISSMQSVISQNSDSESGDSRGIMKGLGACVDLRTVFDLSAEYKDIIVVSLHCNSVWGASYVNGLEVYYGTNAKIYSAENKLLPNELKTNPLNPSYQSYDDAERLRLASVILNNLKNETEFDLRGGNGLFQANFCLLRENNLVNVLVEMGFISNSSDRAFLTDPAGQKRISYAIANGIYEYFCVPGSN
ncbi:MAG: N-acetylmuramoyl-L-alanine amidase [Saccharofermentanales bacterium]